MFSRVALDLGGVLLCTYYCMVLFIYFFTVQISWKIFFSSAISDLFTFFFFLIHSLERVICSCHFKHWRPENYFPPLKLEAPLPTEGQLGKLD